jgi:CheY-like chemotaxis protein
MNILIVDQSLVDAHLTKAALVDGFNRARIRVVHDGVEALTYLHRQGAYRTAPRPDVIVLDLHLPRLTGLNLLGALKTSSALGHIPVVVLTNARLDADQQTTYELGAHYYLYKPREPEAYRMVGYVIAELWQRGLLRPGIRPPWVVPNTGV